MDGMKLVLLFALRFYVVASDWSDPDGDGISPPSQIWTSRNWKRIIAESRAAKRDHPVTWGKLTAVTFCPEGNYIWGYSMVVQTAPVEYGSFNRVDFYCYPLEFPEGKKNFHATEAVRRVSNFNITFADPPGNVNPTYAEVTKFCEPWQGPIIGYNTIQDFTSQRYGIRGIQGICANGDKLDYHVPKAASANNPQYTKVNATCSSLGGRQHLACGFRTRFRFERVFKYIADLDVFCCNPHSGVDSCFFEQKYRVLASVDNRQSDIATYETIYWSNVVEMTETVTNMTEVWAESTHSDTITNEFLENRIQELHTSEIRRKFDREPSLLGLFQGFGDLVEGVTSFLVKGPAGKLLGALGLGELFGLTGGGLPKLVGEPGIRKLIQVGDSGLKHYFKDTPLFPFLSGGGSPSSLLFGNLEKSTSATEQWKQLQRIFTFQGYSMLTDGAAKWSPPTALISAQHIDWMKSFLTNEALLAFPGSSLSFMLSLFGLIKLYGKSTVQQMFSSGELESNLQHLGIGSVTTKSWSKEALGAVENSVVLGQLLISHAIGSLYCPSGIGDIYTIAEKLGLPDLTNAGSKLRSGIFKDLKPNVRECGEVAIIAALASFLPAGHNLLNQVYSNSTVNHLFEEGGLAKIIADPTLNLITNAAKKASASSSQEGFKQLMSLLGLLPAAERFGKVLGSSRFRKIVGSPRLAQIIGSGKFSTENELVRIAGLYGLNAMLGNLTGIESKFQAGVEKSDLDTVLANSNFGSTFVAFTAGQMLELNQLERITGTRTKPLSSLLDPSSMKGRFLGGIVSGLVGGGIKALGGIFSKVLGTGETGRVKKETTKTTSESLTQKYQQVVEEKIAETKKQTIKLESQLRKQMKNDTTETVSETFPAKALTLVLAPELACGDYFTVGISDRSNYIAIIIPDIGTCTPKIVYTPVATFNYLNDPLTEIRSFHIPLGTEWVKIHKYSETKGVRDMINAYARPTAGMSSKVQAYAETLTGQENLILSSALLSSVRMESVWKSPSENGLLEAEANVTQLNYNLVLQLRVRCGDILTYTHHVEVVKFPKVSGCTAKGAWENVPLKSRDGSRKIYEPEIGLMKGGKSVDSLSKQQRDLPEVQEQLLRMLKEISDKFLHDLGSSTAMAGIHWGTDSSLLKNPAWETPLPEKERISVESDGQVTLLQLVAKCGPLTVRMKKYKVTYVDEKRSELRPPNALMEEVRKIDKGEECFAHFPCQEIE